MTSDAISLSQIRFRHEISGFELAIASLEIAAGSHTAIIGPSGCGKTTLLDLIAGIRAPHSGSLRIGDAVISSLPDAQRRDFRAKHIGIVFQDFELLSYLSLKENLLLPYLVNRSLRKTIAKSELTTRAEKLAESFGLSHRLKQRADRLSQGERQRVAIGRALIGEPRVILADEPTGNLDPASKQTAVAQLRNAAKSRSATLVLVTHDHDLISEFDRVIDMQQLLAESG